MSDQELETVDVAEGDGEDEQIEGEDEQIEIDTAGYDDANGETGEPEEVELIDEAGETDVSKERTERKRSRSRSESKKEEDKDDFADSEIDSDADDAELTGDAEAEERELLNMPSLKSVMADVGHLKTERRVIVHPMEWNDLNHPVMVQTVSKDSCEELKLNFVRPKDNPDNWTGIVILHFTSSRAAKEAVDDLKSIREDINVKSEDDAANPRSFVENWLKTEKGQKRWTETLLYIKNINESVTVDQLKEVFSDAEDIVFAKPEYRRKDEKKTKSAYAVYRTAEAAVAAAREYVDSNIELEGETLKVYKYHVPVDNLPRGLLKLYERRVVLKYLEKLNEQLDLETEEQKAPEWCSKRQKTCLSIIEQDNKCRDNLGLPSPSLDELRRNSAVKVLRGSKRKDLLIRLGVIASKRRSSYGQNSRGSSDRRRSYGSSSSHSLLGNPPSLLNLNMRAVPLSLMMQQGNVGYMGRQTMGANEPANKVLRLDASGNFHVDYNRDRQRRRDDKDDRARSSRRYDRR